jgi:hypothetical protein
MRNRSLEVVVKESVNAHPLFIHQVLSLHLPEAKQQID